MTLCKDRCKSYGIICGPGQQQWAKQEELSHTLGPGPLGILHLAISGAQEVESSGLLFWLDGHSEAAVPKERELQTAW